MSDDSMPRNGCGSGGGGRTPARRLSFLRGLKLQDTVAELLHRMGDDTSICVETQSMAAFADFGNVHHISEFAPSQGDTSPRAAARDWVAQLSGTVLSSTGLPAWQSFSYKGISAWWFLEIVFQEPAYLVTRRNQAIAKAAGILGSESVREMRTQPQLPTVPEQRYPVRAPSLPIRWLRSLRKWGRQSGLRFLQLRFLAKLRRSGVLCIVESENLRRHLDLLGSGVHTVLPYAEGVIESLNEQLGEQCTVLTRRPVSLPFEDWEFLGPALPPLLHRPLPTAFEVALEEVVKLAAPMIGGYFSLATLCEIMSLRLAEYDFYLELLDRVKPKTVFLYNWEGVFRPLTTAAKVKGCRVVGVQQALGPYLHALDHHETGYYSAATPMGFPVPDSLALWGPRHAEAFKAYGYNDDSLVITGYARLDKHAQAHSDRTRVREQTCRQLGLDPGDRYLLFTGQSRVLDTVILRDEHFVATVESLCRLAIEFDFKVIMKPWTSDDLGMVQQMASENPGLVFVAPQNVLVSNAALLSMCDWLVGTFSSIMGEAILTGAAGVLLDYPESRYYFDLPHVDIYRPLVPFVGRPEDLEPVLRPLMADESARVAAVARSQQALSPIFGPCDGKAGARIAELVLAPGGH